MEKEEQENLEVNKEINVKEDELKFDPIKHQYLLRGNTLTSVTQCIKTFFEPFDRDYWASYVADRDGKRTEEILYQWEEKRDWGTKIHKFIEDYINGKQEKEYPREVLEAINFLRSLPHARMTPEMKVFSEEWMIAGTIDLVIETPEGIMLFDWKTTNNIKMENSFRQAKAPIDHLDDCNYIQYVLQLNLYKALFERYHGKKVVAMGFVKLVDTGPFEYFPVEDFSHEIGLMMEYWKLRNRIV